MIEIQGKHCTAKVFTDTVEAEAIGQILQLCNQDFVAGSKVRIMPDVHAGKGCVIGFTADLGDKVIPNLVGVDIGCVDMETEYLTKQGWKLIIPINMRDGSILAVGKGNEDWNNSAPHGAGRLMSRSKAKGVLDLESYKETMKDVYSTSVCADTLDEAPMAYKPIEEIIANIADTVDIISIIKPVYNFKSG